MYVCIIVYICRKSRARQRNERSLKSGRRNNATTRFGDGQADREMKRNYCHGKIFPTYQFASDQANASIRSAVFPVSSRREQHPTTFVLRYRLFLLIIFFFSFCLFVFFSFYFYLSSYYSSHNETFFYPTRISRHYYIQGIYRYRVSLEVIAVKEIVTIIVRYNANPRTPFARKELQRRVTFGVREYSSPRSAKVS